MLRKQTGILALMGSLSLGALPLGSTAEASASGCNFVDNANVCIDVLGEGLRVDAAQARFTSIGCKANTNLTITFFDMHNDQYEQFSSPVDSDCSFSGNYTIGLDRDFRQGRVCAALWVDGVARPGACKSIHP